MTSHTIGEVLNRLKDEFDDITISKIRFLEAEGLITPDRTASGYRQFLDGDIERLRYVLRAQRDRYLPLKVIKDELDKIDAGLPLETAPPEPTTTEVERLQAADGRRHGLLDSGPTDLQLSAEDLAGVEIHADPAQGLHSGKRFLDTLHAKERHTSVGR